MPFFSLHFWESKAALPIHSARVSLIIPVSVTNFLVFYEDGFCQLINVISNKVISSQKHQWIARSRIPGGKPESQPQPGCLFLIGDLLNKAGQVIIQLKEDGWEVKRIYQIPLHDDGFLAEYRVLSIFKQEFILRILSNVQNGLALSLMCTQSSKWLSDVIPFSSRFLNSKPINLGGGFALIGRSQKGQGLSYTSISIEVGHQQSKLKIAASRQIKLSTPNFTPVGYIYRDSTLVLIGNSSSAAMLPCTVSLPLLQIENTPQLPVYQVIPFKLHQIGENTSKLMIREVIGELEGQTIVFLQSGSKRYISRVSIGGYGIPIDYIVRQVPASFNKAAISLPITSPFGLISFVHVAETFFQRQSPAPTLLSISYMLPIPKSSYYQEILAQFNTSESINRQTQALLKGIHLEQ